jgi:aminopeptidase N
VLLPLLLLAALQDPLAVRADSVQPRHDALSYAVELTLPAEGKRISASVRTRWRVTGQEPIRIDLDTAFTIRRALVNGRAVAPERAGLPFLLAHGGAAGDTVETVLDYEGVPTDGLVIRDGPNGRTIFADNWPDRARRWLASQDHPSDQAPVSWRIDAPAGLTVVATGALQGIERGGGRTIWRFGLAEPTPVHAMVVGAARFAITELGDGGCPAKCTPVSVYAYPADSAWAVDGPFRRAAGMVDVFGRLFGPFPYPVLRHVQSSTIYGGMENSTAIFYDEQGWAARRLSENTVAHETAHQWFGDAVSQADWHHLWLSEGFATYGGALWQEHVGGPVGLQAAMRGAATAVRRSSVRDRPIIDPAESRLMALLNDNNYPKGAWVLHSLRGLVGDSAFFRGIRRWVEQARHRGVLSRDFADLMREVSGQDLDWYFRQALTQPGYPVLEVATRHRGDSLDVTLRQVQPEAWGLYRIPSLELQVDRTTVRVPLTGREVTVVVPKEDAGPAEVTVDPSGWWLLDTRRKDAP